MFVAALTLLAPLLALPAPRPASGDAWLTDLGPALAVASAEGKDLLVDFTGSDWCGWCKRLDAEVFSQEEFLAYAQREFVLVSLDFPTEGGKAWKAMDPEHHARNRAEGAALGVGGYPTIMLMTPGGVAYATTGYQEGGPGKYVEHLKTLRSAGPRDELLAASARLAQVGDEPVEAELEAIYALLGKVTAAGSGQLMSHLARLDPSDSRGILARNDLEGVRRQHLGGPAPDFTAAAQALDRLLESRPGVDGIGAFHYYRGMVAAERGDAALARSSLARLDVVGGVHARSRDALAQALAKLPADG